MSDHPSARPRIFVAPRRYDGTPKFRYPTTALELTSSRWVVHGIFGPEIGPHSDRLGFYPGDHTIEFYEAESWANVYAVFSPAGEPRGYYCNIGTPARCQDHEIIYTDLDIDLLVRPDGAYTVLDRDEYEEHAARLSYPAELRASVENALARLEAAAARRSAPFDGVEARAFFNQAIRNRAE